MMDYSSFFMRRVGIAAPLLCLCVACGGDNGRETDSAGGTMAMGDSAGMMTGGVGTDTMAGPNNSGMIDPSMAQLLALSNRGEIASGRLASTRATNAEVKAFARDMVTEHQRASRKLDSLAGPSGWKIDSASIAAGMGGMAGGTTGGNMAGGTTGGTTGGATGAAGGGTGSGTGATGGSTAAAGGTMTGTTAAGDTRLLSILQQMQQMQTKSMQDLRNARGAEFDRSYMDSQIAAHQQVLDLLNRYANNLQNNDLRTFATELRTSVQQHAQRAEEIKRKLDTAA